MKRGPVRTGAHPSQADLVLQISLTGANIHLAILDSKTQASLWELKQNIHGVFRHTVQHDDFDKAIAALVKSTAKLAGQPAAEISVPRGLKYRSRSVKNQ